jgi:hypothetical protein
MTVLMPRFEMADTLTLDIERGSDEARLEFRGPDNAPLIVTIPKREVARLHASIVHKLAQEPALFARASRRDRS